MTAEGRIVFLDTETGGLDLGSPITQVAAVAYGNNPTGFPEAWVELEVFERKLIFDEARCSPEALRVNSYNPDVWKVEAVSEEAAMYDLKAFLDRHSTMTLTSKRTGRPYTVARVGGHNVSFDLPRISEAFKRHKFFLPICWNAVLDTLHGASWYFTKQGGAFPVSLRLEEVGRLLGIEYDATILHDALADARLSALIAQKLLT